MKSKGNQTGNQLLANFLANWLPLTHCSAMS